MKQLFTTESKQAAIKNAFDQASIAIAKAKKEGGVYLSISLASISAALVSQLNCISGQPSIIQFSPDHCDG